MNTASSTTGVAPFAVFFDAVNEDGQTSLVDDLQGLLEKQIEMARRGNLRRVEALAEQADSVISKIAQVKTPEQPDLIRQRQRLTELYKQLELMLSANKDNIARQLRQTKGIRKTLQAYRNNA